MIELVYFVQVNQTINRRENFPFLYDSATPCRRNKVYRLSNDILEWDHASHLFYNVNYARIIKNVTGENVTKLS